MELRQFRYFVLLADALHFGRAATLAGIAQPALSQQIRRIERELGVSLFERTKRIVRLTEAGRVFLPEAKAALAQAEKALAVVDQAAKSRAGRLTVGIVGSAMHAGTISLVQQFRERRPQVDLSIRFLTGDQPAEALRVRELDVAFSRPFSGETALEQFVVARENLIAVLPHRHRLAKSAVVKTRDLAAEPFVLFERERSTVLFDAIIATCGNGGFSPNITLHGDEIHSIIALVAAGLGVAIVPESLRHATVRHATFRRLSPKTATVDLAVAWRKDDPSPLVATFVEEARRLQLE